MKLIINGVPPWDGEYEFAGFTDLTNREFFRIKEICGIRAGELMDALAAGDTGAWVGFACVVLSRHGKSIEPDALWDAHPDAIDFEFDEEASGDADPPTQPPSSDGSSESESSSGPSSESGSD